VKILNFEKSWGCLTPPPPSSKHWPLEVALSVQLENILIIFSVNRRSVEICEQRRSEAGLRRMAAYRHEHRDRELPPSSNAQSPPRRARDGLPRAPCRPVSSVYRRPLCVVVAYIRFQGKTTTSEELQYGYVSVRKLMAIESGHS